jgi:hypothetical protein
VSLDDLITSKRTAVPVIVATKLDFNAWLETLTDNQRNRVMDLASGAKTSELAQVWNVSAPAVSLYKRQLQSSYEAFISKLTE